MTRSSGESLKITIFVMKLPQGPRSQSRNTGKVTQITMFWTSKKALILRFEQNDLKITYTYSDHIPFDEYFFYL